MQKQFGARKSHWPTPRTNHRSCGCKIPRCYWERHSTLKSFCKESRRNFFGGGEAGIWIKHGVLVGGKLILESLLLVGAVCSSLLAQPIAISLCLWGLFLASFLSQIIKLIPATNYLQDFNYVERWRRVILFEYLTKYWGIIGYWKGFLAGAKHCTECRERLSTFQLNTTQA